MAGIAESHMDFSDEAFIDFNSWASQFTAPCEWNNELFEIFKSTFVANVEKF